MNSFDRSVVTFVNSFAQHSTTFDRLVVFHSHSSLLQGAFAMTVFWWAWFRRRDHQREDQTMLLATLAGSILAFGVGRLLALTLPLRARPMHDPTLHLILPFGMGPDEFRGWSAFPSDHAMLFFALAWGIWFVAKRAGLILLIHAAFVVCLPRIYLGLHYPTDILGGAAIGILVVSIVMMPRIRETLARPWLAWLDRSPGTFYAALFVVSIELASMLQGPRALLELVRRLLRHLP